MISENLRFAFLALFAGNFLVEAGLGWLNRLEIRKHASPPAAFQGSIDKETFNRIRAYSLEKSFFDQWASAWSAATTLILLFSGLLPWLDTALKPVFGSGAARGTAFLVLVLTAQTVIGLPFTLYSTFKIEGQFGFNTLTWGLFWKDFAKGASLSLCLALPSMYALLALVEKAGFLWWLWTFAVIAVFQFVMAVAYPLFIAPLFNRFQPLKDGPLKSSLLDLSHRLGFPAGGIFVMDGSRRSLHSNAYFTGLGRFRRIILFDTLISQLNPCELQSVLAHEIGHYKLGHILKSMAWQLGMLFATLCVLNHALDWSPLYTAFRFPSDLAGSTGHAAVGAYLFFTTASCLALIFSPLRNMLSRRHEFEADAYAAKAMGNTQVMGSALLKLSLKNLTNLTPHPWFSAYHYSHPALSERLKALDLPN